MANRSQLYKYKGNKCTSCGISVEEMVERYGTFERMFELHHIEPKEKHKNYKNIIRNTISADQITEVDKCALLCKQCHGIVHAQNIEVTLNASIKIEKRTITQMLKGWLITDRKDSSITFITNDRVLLEPCFVRYGDFEEQLCLLEIDATYLEKILKKIETYKTLEVYSQLDNRFMMKVESVKDKIVNITQTLGVPIFSLNFDVEEGDASYLWVRNGIVLTKEGNIQTEGVFSSEGVELTI